MKKNIFFLLVFIGSISCTSKKGQTGDPHKQPTDWVNVFVGTGGHGHTYPGATVPFGMVQVSPDNGKDGWDYSSGYNYQSDQIAGFSMTHLSGTGVGDLCELSFMPFSGTQADTGRHGGYNHFSHKNESGEPGYYSLKMANGIRVELTASKRVGLYRYRYPQGSHGAVSLNLGFSINHDHPTATYLRLVSDTLAVGYRKSTGWANQKRVYFAVAFSQPIVKFVGTQEGQLVRKVSTLKGQTSQGFFFFTPKGDSLLQKVAISAVSIANARQNLRWEVPGWNFDKVKQAARATWNNQLSKIEVQSSDTAKLHTFYSALYHTMLAPTLYMDSNHQYRGADRKVHTAHGFKAYSTFSLWDTYRAEHPLLTFIDPERVNGMIKFMLAFYEQHGLLPKWELKANETHTMIGYSAIPVIVDAYFKGFRDYDVHEAFEAMKKSATRQNKAVQMFNSYGYVPDDKGRARTASRESVSKTLLYSYDDWCIAQMGRALGKQQDYKTYSKRAGYYKNLYDSSTGFMRPKSARGEWMTPFDPMAEPENHSERHYTEANAWQVSLYVPQDVDELIKMIGGRREFVEKLDSLFDISPESNQKHHDLDITGIIGQYVQGNEPDQQVPYLYDYAGAPWKTQRVVRTIVDSLYSDNPAGLPGNDDCGQMSAWYVLSALGFYPVNPANGVYAIGSPSFPEATIHLQGGKTFTIKAKNASKKNIYIQSARLNGTSYSKPYITYQDIMAGDTLQFTMGSQPNKKWGAAYKVQPPRTAFMND